MGGPTRRELLTGIGAMGFVSPVAVLAAAPPKITTGRIEGRIHLGGRRARGYDMAIVHIVGKDPQLPRSTGVEHEIQQKDMEFRPAMSAVVVGTTLSFPNDDDVYHNVYSKSKPLQFNIDTYKNESKSRVARKPGFIEIRCDRHAEMRAYVLVLQTRFYARPDPDGHYVINGVPEGVHTVEVWQPHVKHQRRQEVKVVAGQATTYDQRVVRIQAPRGTKSDGTPYDPY